MQKRLAWAVFGVLVSTAACGQVLGLGNYSEAPEGGAVGTLLDAAIDATGEDRGTASHDAPSDMVSQLGTDATVAGDGTSDLEAALDAAFDGGDAGDTHAADAQKVGDATVDGSFDAPPPDAPVDAFVCPPECNSGCGDGGTCVITITSFASGPVTCPPDIACQVHCLGAQVCTNTINCAAGHPCKVTCDGDQACTGNNINQGAATSLCVDCLSTMGFGGSCNSVTCTATTCSIRCGGGGGGGGSCGGSCGNCTRVFACP